jgi:hypothetical protein
MGGVAAGALGFAAIGRYSSALLFGAIALFSAVGHVVLRAIHRRRARAKRRGADDRVRIVETVPRWARVGTTICLVAAFALVPVCLLPVILVELFDLPLVKSSDLEVVSPGDTVVLTLNGAMAPFPTYRVARVRARVSNAGALGGPEDLRIEPLAATGTSETKQHGVYRVRHSVRLEIPNEPRWAGETARVGIQVVFENPDKQALIREGSSWETVEIPVASEGAGPMYRSAWRLALLSGALPAVFAGLVLAGLAGIKPPAPPA